MQTITVDELKARLDKGETVNLLDVREDHERADFNIGGTHIPIGKIQAMQLDGVIAEAAPAVVWQAFSWSKWVLKIP